MHFLMTLGCSNYRRSLRPKGARGEAIPLGKTNRGRGEATVGLCLFVPVASASAAPPGRSNYATEESVSGNRRTFLTVESPSSDAVPEAKGLSVMAVPAQNVDAIVYPLSPTVSRRQIHGTPRRRRPTDSRDPGAWCTARRTRTTRRPDGVSFETKYLVLQGNHSLFKRRDRSPLLPR